MQPAKREAPSFAAAARMAFDLGVRGRIAIELPAVLPGTDELACARHDHRSDRNLAQRRCLSGESERFPHPPFVLRGEFRLDCQTGQF